MIFTSFILPIRPHPRKVLYEPCKFFGKCSSWRCSHGVATPEIRRRLPRHRFVAPLHRPSHEDPRHAAVRIRASQGSDDVNSPSRSLTWKMGLAKGLPDFLLMENEICNHFQDIQKSSLKKRDIWSHLHLAWKLHRSLPVTKNGGIKTCRNLLSIQDYG